MLKVGTRVHCNYRHPDGFGQNVRVGIVIAPNDPRIWTNTLAFRGEPTQEQVDRHLEWCTANNLPLRDTPVDWGNGVFLWDDTEQVHPYEQCPICLK